ncbi:tRNA lysidine(34) synthetase TilS [Noviherbaspirillum sp. ST9]|uniref:tRNA lysidine(34) synthetase TilS n=1 Tax=Noviherbaspirillum sp. ST9 TaxID=3401606 RepID=UPI003B588837
MTYRQAASLEDAFERALGAILARVSASEGPIALAYSGGLDSAALLHLAYGHARGHGLELVAFHVHHGLSENADCWLEHCERECAALGIRFEARRIALEAMKRDGVEQAARTKRYAALGGLCRSHDARVLLTAHHQDDQAETVLLQLLRGAGVAGLSGMATMNDASSLLGTGSPCLARPLLDMSRAELEEFVARRGIAYVSDESNEDIRFSRNALRHKITPVLEAHFPAYQKCIARTAEHAQAAHRLLGELADLDWQACGDGQRIDLAAFRGLGDDRQDNLLRHWFSRRDARMPSTAWLMEAKAQLLGACDDAQVRVVHPDCEIRRHRGKAYLIPRSDSALASAMPRIFSWKGEPSIAFKEFGGSLHFDAAENGVDTAWLAAQSLQIRWRQGGERLKLAAGRPTRSLKQHYQALDTPVWERQRLPVVLAGGKLIFAAGIGMNHVALPGNPSNPVRLRWESDII